MAVGVDASAAVDWWSQITAVFGVGAQLDQSRVPSGYHPTRSATLARGKHIVGYVGEIDRQVLTKYGIEDRVACLEVDASVLLGESPKVPTAKPVSRFPSSDFDLAFAAPTKVTAAAVQRAVKQAAGALGEDVVLFDVFRKAATACDCGPPTARLPMPRSLRLAQRALPPPRNWAAPCAAKVTALRRRNHSVHPKMCSKRCKWAPRFARRPGQWLNRDNPRTGLAC
jgi:hypothetical protein